MIGGCQDDGRRDDPCSTLFFRPDQQEALTESDRNTGDGQLQRIRIRTPFSSDWLRQLTAARSHSSTSESGAFWWQIDCTGEEIRRNTPHSGRYTLHRVVAK